MTGEQPLRYFVGLTGGSGHAYAERLIIELLRAGCEVDLSITEAGCKVLRHELGVEAGLRGERLLEALPGWLGGAGLPDGWEQRVRVFTSDAIEAPAASGTSLTGGVIIASSRLIISRTPYQIGSIPNAIMVGSRIGVVIRIIAILPSF